MDLIKGENDLIVIYFIYIVINWEEKCETYTYNYTFKHKLKGMFCGVWVYSLVLIYVGWTNGLFCEINLTGY